MNYLSINMSSLAINEAEIETKEWHFLESTIRSCNLHMWPRISCLGPCYLNSDFIANKKLNIFLICSLFQISRKTGILMLVFLYMIFFFIKYLAWKSVLLLDMKEYPLEDGLKIVTPFFSLSYLATSLSGSHSEEKCL